MSHEVNCTSLVLALGRFGMDDELTGSYSGLEVPFAETRGQSPRTPFEQYCANGNFIENGKGRIETRQARWLLTCSAVLTCFCDHHLIVLPVSSPIWVRLA